MSGKLRVGIIGAGANTRLRHIPGLRALPDVSIDAVCNRSPESSRKAAEELGIPRICENWEALTADPDLDAVVIGTWPYLHAAASLSALAHGKHVLCEARMAMNLREARAMVDAAAARPDLIAQIVPSPFTLPWDATLARLLRVGTIGRLLAVDVYANCGGFADLHRPMTWREDESLSGVNIMTLGIYYEAMARWTGHAASVLAHGTVHVAKRRDADGAWRELRIPDSLDVIGRLECGADYHIRCSQVTGACPTPNDFLLYGETGSLRLNLQEKILTLHRPGAEPEAVEVPVAEQSDWRVEAEFVGAIRGREKVRLTTFPEALRYMEFTQRVTDALAASSELRKN